MKGTRRRRKVRGLSGPDAGLLLEEAPGTLGSSGQRGASFQGAVEPRQRSTDGHGVCSRLPGPEGGGGLTDESSGK